MQQEFDTLSSWHTKKKRQLYPHTPEQIAQEFKVDEHGILWWLKPGGHNRKVHKPVGTIDSTGYLRVRIGDTLYRNHTIAFCLYYERWPYEDKVIDHIDGDKTNNRKENLRELSLQENALHKHVLNRRNKSGHHGVSWCNHYEKWVARITYKGKLKQRYFYSKEDAIAMRLKWESELDFTSPVATKYNNQMANISL